MPLYPAQIDNIRSLPIATNNNSPVPGVIFNKLREAVLQVETELGIKPSGPYSTVQERFSYLESIVGNLKIIELRGDLGGTLRDPTVIQLQGRPLSNVEPRFNEVLTWNGIAWVPRPASGGGGVLPPGNDPGQTLVWDGNEFLPDFLTEDDILPGYRFDLLEGDTVFFTVGQECFPEIHVDYDFDPDLVTVTNSDELPTETVTTQVINEKLISLTNGYTKTNFNDTVTLTVHANHGRSHISRTRTLTWGQPLFWGTGLYTIPGRVNNFASISSFFQLFLSSLSGNSVTNDPNKTFNVNADSVSKVYFACRAEYGNVLFYVNSLAGGFTKIATDYFDNGYGVIELYDLYESDNVGLGQITVNVVPDPSSSTLEDNLLRFAALRGFNTDIALFKPDGSLTYVDTFKDSAGNPSASSISQVIRRADQTAIALGTDDLTGYPAYWVIDPHGVAGSANLLPYNDSIEWGVLFYDNQVPTAVKREDDTIVVIGYHKSISSLFNYDDVWVISTDNTATLLRSRQPDYQYGSFGGTEYRIHLKSDGNIVIGGWKWTNIGGQACATAYYWTLGSDNNIGEDIILPGYDAEAHTISYMHQFVSRDDGYMVISGGSNLSGSKLWVADNENMTSELTLIDTNDQPVEVAIANDDFRMTSCSNGNILMQVSSQYFVLLNTNFKVISATPIVDGLSGALPFVHRQDGYIVLIGTQAQGAIWKFDSAGNFIESFTVPAFIDPANHGSQILLKSDTILVLQRDDQIPFKYNKEDLITVLSPTTGVGFIANSGCIW